MRAAVYTGSRNLYQHMVVAVKSILINSNVERVYLLIEDDDFPYELPDCVEIRNVSDQKYFKPDGANMNSKFTYLAMMRAALAFEFPKLDKILSLDVDTIINRNISELWDLSLDGYYFAAAQEHHRTRNGFLYTNTGVALYNLEKLRDGKAQEVIDVLNMREYSWVEQDVFNYLCQGRILELPSEYNINEFTLPPIDQKIVHYAGMKKWDNKPEYIKFKDVPFERVMELHKWRLQENV